MLGEISSAYAGELRATLKAIGSLTPPHVVARVRRKLKERDRTIDVEVESPKLDGKVRAGNPIRD